jgi:hypothetical protein
MLYNIDPWGERRADLRAARMTWAALQGPRSGKVPDESKYLLTFRTTRLAETPDEYRLRAMSAWASAAGGFVVGKP